MPLSPSEFINQILCGDALQVIKTLPDACADLLITDPPYGNNIAYGETRKRRIAGDEHPLLGLMVLSAAWRLLKKNATAYMFFGIRHLPLIQSFFQSYTRYRIRDILIWDRQDLGLGYAFRKQYEGILVLEKGKPHYRLTDVRTLLSIQRVNTREHPHKKPVELLELLIRHSSDVGEVVFDPFLGSGTTAVAAQQLGRHYFGIEIDPHYTQVAQQRLQTLDRAFNPHIKTHAPIRRNLYATTT